MTRNTVTKTPPITRPTFNSDRLIGLFGGQQFLKKNKKKFKGVTIAKHYNGKILKNKFGECYKISDKTKIDTIEPSHDRVKQKLLLDLKVIAGIAEITESNLRQEGINSVTELTKHSRYGTDATTYLNLIENKNAIKIYEHLTSRGFTSSNPLLLANSAFF